MIKALARIIPGAPPNCQDLITPNGVVYYAGNSHYIWNEGGKLGVYDDSLRKNVLPFEFQQMMLISIYSGKLLWIWRPDGLSGVYDIKTKLILVPIEFRQVRMTPSKDLFDVVLPNGQKKHLNIFTYKLED